MSPAQPLARRHWPGAVLALLFLCYCGFAPQRGPRAVVAAWENLLLVLQVLPPVLLLVALLDTSVRNETVARHMGPGAGVKGPLLALLLGTISAGPLLLAFPIAAMLARKGARYGLVLFFIACWSTTKLTVLVFELACMGGLFTALHLSIGLGLGWAGAMLMERLAGPSAQARLARAELAPLGSVAHAAPEP